MSLKAKLTRLENRLGVERCPHCGEVPEQVLELEEILVTSRAEAKQWLPMGNRS